MPLNTYLRPRVTGEPWNGNSSGTLLSSRYSIVATTGGVAPMGSCEAGAKARVAYTANYYFFTAK